MIQLTLDPTLELVTSENYDTKEKLKNIQPKEDHDVYTPIKKSEFYHKNYMDYLGVCYDRHMGYVLSPEMVWYFLLAEIAAHIKKDPEKYRSLFTDSDEKKDIMIECTGTEKFIELIMKELKKLVPTDTGVFLPSFSTDTPESVFSKSCAFCDAVSPFYDYMMYCCGFPSVMIKGDYDDWDKVLRHFKYIARTLKLNSHYTGVVRARLQTILDSLDNPEEHKHFYQDIFKLERCGSGGQVEATGWITELFMEIPSTRYTHNFSTQVSTVNFTNLTEDKDYRISTGLFVSNYDEKTGVAIPEFTHVLFKMKEKVNKETECLQ